MRRTRVKVINGKYHITSRINNRENFLEAAEVKAMFLEVLKRAKKKYKFIIHNLCIMNNHVHYIIETGKNLDLSKAVQWINSVFAMGYNASYGHTGHVWGERFHSTLIIDIRQFIRTYFYIANNPVKAGIVNNAADYFFNGVTFILQKKYELVQKPKGYILDMIIKNNF